MNYLKQIAIFCIFEIAKAVQIKTGNLLSILLLNLGSDIKTMF